MIGAAGRTTLVAATLARSRISPSSTSVSRSRTSQSSSIQSCRFTGPNVRGAGAGYQVRGDVSRVIPSRDASSQVSTSSASPPSAVTSAQSGAAISIRMGSPAASAGGGTRSRRTTPASWRRPSPSTSQAPGLPDAASRSRSTVRGGDVGHVDGQDDDCRGRAGRARRPLRSVLPAVLRRPVLAGERHGPGGGRLRPDDHGLRGPGDRVQGQVEQPPAVAGEARPCRRLPSATPYHRSAPPPPSRRRRSRRHGGRLAPMQVVLVQEASSLDPEVNRGRLAALVPDGADLVVLPESFARDFGEPGSAVAPHAEPLDGPFATEVARVAAERGTTVVAGMFEEAGERPFNTLVVRGAASAAYRKIHLYDSFGYQESAGARGRRDRAARARARGLHRRDHDLLRPAFPRARPPPRRRGGRGARRPGGVGRGSAQGRPLDDVAAGPRDREHRLRRGRRTSRARATPATRWWSGRWATCWSRPATGRRCSTPSSTRPRSSSARRTNPSLANRRL